ncbi:hypothetical protein BJ973_002869 [Actinoplanes tereljensis]|uniref:Uncharacterized protein n=1 Tax=Paractinoplanes tereljensis TaxID=571912 RepID=A0A919NP97_9ACTN|nr:hypothetical protein [Actinoplanes tereljensis]GIF22546.1 hypothetical protein Ate02nite_52760 [Actinoplanes tereljensis]
MTLAGQEPTPDPGPPPTGQTITPTWPVIDKPSRGFRAPAAISSGLAVLAVVFATAFLRGGSSGPAPFPGASESVTPTTASPSSTEPMREVALNSPPPGVVSSDVFRSEGFLVSADPGATTIKGCANARSAAVVDGPAGKFLTSSLPDDPTQCHTVPLLIDFLADSPAGALQVTALTPNTLTMDVIYKDLTSDVTMTLTVTDDKVQAHGGIDMVLIRPATDSGAPVAVTRLRFAPLK